MPRIQQLPPSVVTKIAAGEVIERPASVVKELLENSIDAGSRRIDVDIEQGGVELIRVVDDGSGISASDLPLAFASHATSKLATADDLFRIRTMGFRGEALASIGGVAQVAIQSRLHDQPSGAQVACQGGDIEPPRPWNGSPGTRLEVRHLFFNTPVRRKFLRTTATEMGHICEVFTRIALAQPDLHLTLRHNGKLVYDVPASAGLVDRLGLFFGEDLKKRLYELSTEQKPARLYGYIADPACERGNARMQYLFVNRRWIRDRSLGHALQEAYRGLLMTGRYAVAFLFLEVPADQVDVNVHPTKVEVRFREGSAHYHLVLGSIRDRLRKENLTARLQPPQVSPGAWSVERLPPLASLPEPARGLWREAPGQPPIGHPPSRQYPFERQPSWHDLSTVSGHGAADRATTEGLRHGNANEERSQARALDRHPLEASDSSPIQVLPPEAEQLSSSTLAPACRLKAIQLYNSYLVLETEEGMLVIDQHALHERILFEQLKERVRAGTLESQRLLIPEPVELTSEQSARVLEQRDALAELGLGVEDFGGGTLLVTSYPVLLEKRSPQEILRAVVDHLVARDRLPNREQLLSDLLSLMACHAAVRAGDLLSAEEIAALVSQRELAQDTHHCPHGRPTALLFSRQELDRQFRRI
jgi:DNA mismatch repair protein MutL